MHGSSLYVYASMYRCVCMHRVYMYVQVFIRCICMDQVYMYMRVSIGVSACSEFICMCVCCCEYICMDRVYMYKRVSIGVYACIKFICIRKLFTSVYIHY